MRIYTFVLLCLLMPVCSADAIPSAYDSVRTATDELLSELTEIKPLYEQDQVVFFREIDGALAPFMDFDGFSRGVMAKFYQRATPAQREAFSGRFRESLVQTYSKALIGFDNQKVVVLEKNSPNNDPSKTTVLLEIHGKDGSIYPVEYSLVLLDNKWKLRNVVINGINLGLQFKSQFAFYMQTYRNDIDSVIKHWRVDE